MRSVQPMHLPEFNIEIKTIGFVRLNWDAQFVSCLSLFVSSGFPVPLCDFLVHFDGNSRVHALEQRLLRAATELFPLKLLHRVLLLFG